MQVLWHGLVLEIIADSKDELREVPKIATRSKKY